MRLVYEIYHHQILGNLGISVDEVDSLYFSKQTSEPQ